MTAERKLTDDIGIPCPTAPERIWLQSDPEPEEEGTAVYPNYEYPEVTWCQDKINNNDTLYIRADLVAAVREQDGALLRLSREALRATLSLGYSRARLAALTALDARLSHE